MAWIWPVFSPPEEYIQETQNLVRIIRRWARPGARTLLHLGCGGGHNDFTFKRHFQVTGIDLSRAMLKLASALNPESRYVYGDMRSARLGARFDIVFAGDSINHMCSERDLARVFHTAWTHLSPGGVFLVVAEYSKERFQDNRTTVETHARGDLTVTTVEYDSDLNPGDSVFETAMVHFIRRRGRLETECDRFRLGIFSLSTWKKLLRTTGFRVIQTRLSLPSLPGKPSYPLFVCLKPRT